MNPVRELKKITNVLARYKKQALYKFNIADIHRLKTLLDSLKKHEDALEQIYNDVGDLSDATALSEIENTLGKTVRDAVDEAIGLEYQINDWLEQNSDGFSEKHIVGGHINQVLDSLESIFEV